ncbi:MAG: hypothetical protein CTY38_01310 [Methylotenera sp.]|uniref:hypothetical protein n=1 Tax=Methylotenera sp. TaxID=2051956 RepID=UPI000D3F1BC1|nr:hypothetical protein [Methylotenera sp.]PPC84713.1 MAG: hypothetical protein CTY38_01310 [Methylotenera sp.]
MLTNEGINHKGQTNWKLRVPAEHCKPGLEVLLFTNVKGMVVGGVLVTWEELDRARARAKDRFSTILDNTEQRKRA